MRCKWLVQLPQIVRNEIEELIKAYYEENGMSYNADVMNEKCVNIMFLGDDIYLQQITAILKLYV